MSRNQWTLVLLTVSLLAALGIMTNMIWFTPAP